MTLKSTVFAALAVGASLALAQTDQDRVFKFAHTHTLQQMQEIATLIQHIADITDLSVDKTGGEMRVHATADQMALAGWLFNELDQPGNDQPPPQGHAGPVLEYQKPGSSEIVRIFYVPYVKTLQEFQETVVLARSISGVPVMMTENTSHAVVTRATADQTAIAEWLFNELAKPANPGSAVPTYRVPSGSDDNVRLFHVSPPKTLQEFQEIATLIRSIGDIRYLFTDNAQLAFAARGTSDQLDLAGWLVNELDKSTHVSPSPEYTMSNGVENTVRVFYLPNAGTVQQFQQMATSLRSKTLIRRVFTYNTPRALALRGTPTQIAQAAQLLAE